jgi:hypothetical protein
MELTRLWPTARAHARPSTARAHVRPSEHLHPARRHMAQCCPLHPLPPLAQPIIPERRPCPHVGTLYPFFSNGSTGTCCHTAHEDDVVHTLGCNSLSGLVQSCHLSFLEVLRGCTVLVGWWCHCLGGLLHLPLRKTLPAGALHPPPLPVTLGLPLHPAPGTRPCASGRLLHRTPCCFVHPFGHLLDNLKSHPEEEPHELTTN